MHSHMKIQGRHIKTRCKHLVLISNVWDSTNQRGDSRGVHGCCSLLMKGPSILKRVIGN